MAIYVNRHPEGERELNVSGYDAEIIDITRRMIKEMARTIKNDKEKYKEDVYIMGEMPNIINNMIKNLTWIKENAKLRSWDGGMGDYNGGPWHDEFDY